MQPEWTERFGPVLFQCVLAGQLHWLLMLFAAREPRAE